MAGPPFPSQALNHNYKNSKGCNAAPCLCLCLLQTDSNWYNIWVGSWILLAVIEFSCSLFALTSDINATASLIQWYCGAL